MSTADNDEVERIARDVQAYLERHPHAADTLEGVVKWWLMRQRYDQAEGLVGKALNMLEHDGLIAKATTSDGRTIYSSAAPGKGGTRGN
ncbi:MAG: hypothetical protein P8103_08340 [Candidatus Thiodiazotropha sp.]